MSPSHHLMGVALVWTITPTVMLVEMVVTCCAVKDVQLPFTLAVGKGRAERLV